MIYPLFLKFRFKTLQIKLLIRHTFTCKDIDFRFGFSASGGLRAAVEAGWAGDVGWDEAAGLLTPPAMLLPEL